MALSMLAGSACADVYSGVTAARSVVAVSLQASGVVEEISAQTGSVVEVGEVLARTRSKKVFANRDGVVAKICAETGDRVSGSVMEVQPVSEYTLYCTASEAYDATEMQALHNGETLYLSCTYNGTHRGSGRVYAIDGNEYMLEALAGEFYVGETVYLYRDAACSSKQRVGIATVVSAPTESYEAEGTLGEIYVGEGEYVERGELLYEVIDGKNALTEAPVGGVVTQCVVRAGEAAQEGRCVAYIAPWDEICVEIQVDEAAASKINVGDAAEMYFAYAEDCLCEGYVAEISALSQGEGYTLRIRTEDEIRYLGATVQVYIEKA